MEMEVVFKSMHTLHILCLYKDELSILKRLMLDLLRVLFHLEGFHGSYRVFIKWKERKFTSDSIRPRPEETEVHAQSALCGILNLLFRITAMFIIIKEEPITK